jgi:hypothetical protein
MKMFRSSIALVALLCLSGFAHAGSIHAVIVDPPFGPYAYDLQPGDTQIPAADFLFGHCNAGELTRLPSGFSSADSCFEVYNDSGAAVTGVNIQFTAPTSLFGTGSSITCAGLFSVTSCTQSGGLYDLDFGGGSVPNGYSFIIGVQSPGGPSDFNGVTITPELTLTPEPSSVALLSTGILALGSFAFFKRRPLGFGSPQL